MTDQELEAFAMEQGLKYVEKACEGVGLPPIVIELAQRAWASGFVEGINLGVETFRLVGIDMDIHSLTGH